MVAPAGNGPQASAIPVCFHGEAPGRTMGSMQPTRPRLIGILHAAVVLAAAVAAPGDTWDDEPIVDGRGVMDRVIANRPEEGYRAEALLVESSRGRTIRRLDRDDPTQARRAGPQLRRSDPI